MKRTMSFFILSVLMILPGSMRAEEKKSGWSGHFILGVGGKFGRDSQLQYDKDYETIKSLDERRDRESKLLPVLLFDIGYTFEATGTTLFALHQVDDSGVGVSQSLGDFGDLSFSIDYKQEKVWEDPYLVDKKREDTEAELPGFAIGWENMMGTGLILEYKGLDVDVDDDRIGEREEDLQRDGRIHTLEAGYFIMLNEDTVIIPHVAVIDGRMDGKSNRFEGYEAGLACTFSKKDVFAIDLSVSGGKNEYDKEHPVFDEKREDKTYSAGASFTYFKPFGFENYFVSIMGGYERVNSNIDFFDSSTAMIGVGIGYQF